MCTGIHEKTLLILCFTQVSVESTLMKSFFPFNSKPKGPMMFLILGVPVHSLSHFHTLTIVFNELKKTWALLVWRQESISP